MKKKTFGRFTAIGIAALTAIPAFVIPASAASFDYNATAKTVWGTVYYDGSNIMGVSIFYSTRLAASNAGISNIKSDDIYSLAGGHRANVTFYSDGALISLSTTGNYTIVASSGSSSGSTSGSTSKNPTDPFYTPTSKYLYADANYVYKVGNGYFPNRAAAEAKVGTSGAYRIYEETPANKYSASRKWFSYTKGNYYATEDEAYRAGGDGSYYYISSGSSSSTGGGVYTNATVYKSSKTGRYYLTSADAYAAGGTVTPVTTEVRGGWYNYNTGKFYSSEALAKSDTNSPSTDVVYLPYIYDNSYYSSSYYYNYYYNDPYFMYYYNKEKSDSGSSTNSSTVTTTDPIISGTRVYGWSAIASNMSSYKNKTVEIKMNEATEVPKSVITAVKNNNVTLSLTMSNGSIWTIKGSDITTAKTINLGVEYGAKNIPAALVSKARKGAVASSQLTLGMNSKFGCDADITVKFSSKRAGKSVKLYRYNSAKNSLVLVDTAKVTSTGAVTFTIDQGGDFVAVIG